MKVLAGDAVAPCQWDAGAQGHVLKDTGTCTQSTYHLQRESSLWFKLETGAPMEGGFWYWIGLQCIYPELS